MCINICKPPFGWHGKPCDECAADYAEWMDDLPILTRELARCREYDRAIPATDRERTEWLDQVAPVVPELKRLTFTLHTGT